MAVRRTRSDVPVRPEPTSDDVARRAYALYEARGSEPGADLDDWFRAERELRDLRTGPVTKPSHLMSKPIGARHVLSASVRAPTMRDRRSPRNTDVRTTS